MLDEPLALQACELSVLQLITNRRKLFKLGAESSASRWRCKLCKPWRRKALQTRQAYGAASMAASERARSASRRRGKLCKPLALQLLQALAPNTSQADFQAIGIHLLG